MKLKSILASAVVCIMAASCAEKPIHDLDPNMMNGNYDGVITNSVKGAIMLPTSESTISLEVLDEQHLTVSMKFSGADLKFENCAVERINGGFSFSHPGLKQVISTPGMGGGAPKPTNYVFSAVNGTFTNGKLDFTYSYKPGVMPMNVTETFAQVDKEILALAGERNVQASMIVGGPAQPEEKKVTVYVHTNNSISFSFPEMGTEGMMIPAFDFTAAKLTVKDGVFSFTGTDFEKVFKDKSKPEDPGLKVAFSKMEGKFENGKLTLSYTAKPGAMPMPIKFTYAE